MSALARGSDASLVELPREVWSRGSRPLQGRAIRWGVATSIVLLGLSFPMMSVRIGAMAIAALVFFGLFPLVDSRLETLGKTLASASRSESAKLMGGLENRWLVSRFAPHVWVSAQKGRLNMIKGDSRAAAAAFAEAARQSGNAQQPDLVGSQAHALALSGDPKGARQLLVGMEERKELRPLDMFNLGVVYVEEPGKTSRAVELLESARKDLGAGPRTDAALALAFARGGKPDDAASLLEAMDESEFEDDDTAKALHKRARRSLRQATDSKGTKGKRKSASTATETPESAKPGKGKRDRRKDRREKRKARGGKKSRKEKGSDAAEAEELKADATVEDTLGSASPEAATETAAAQKAAPEKGASEKAEERAMSEKDASEKAAADKAAAEKSASGKAASEKAASEKAAADKAAEDKAAEDKAAEDKAASENAAAEKAAEDEAAEDKAASEKAAFEKAASEKAAEDKAASEKAAEDKAASEKAAEDKAAAEKAAAEKAAEDKAAAEKAAAEEKAIAKAAADKVAEEREARARIVAEALARSAKGDDTSEEKAKAEAESAARAAAERAREKAEAKAAGGAAIEKPLFGSDSQPLFVPPPVPAFGSDTGPRTVVSAATKSVASKLPAPPKVGPPKVTAPPVVDSGAKKPAIDTDGWDDLFGED